MRLPDWDSRLARWASARLGQPFEWGRTDCALLAFEALDAMTGSALTGQYRDAWHDRASALDYQHTHDTDLARALAAAGASPGPEPAFAQRGDVLIVDTADFACGHICFGERTLTAPEGGLVGWVQTAALVRLGARVWRV